MSRELMASNFMEALLRAALIMGDPRQEQPVNEIRILARVNRGANQQLHPRCRITMEPACQVPPSERVQIVYPATPRRVS